MKYCSNCGNALDENMICPNCKCDFSNKNNSNEKESIVNDESNVKSDKVKKNGLAIAGFVISLVSLLCCGASSWIGLVFSIIGLCESKKYNNDGKSLSIAGIIISACMLVLWIILYYLGVIFNVVDNANNNIDFTLPFETMFMFL